MNKKIYLMRPFVREEELEAVRKVLEAEVEIKLMAFNFLTRRQNIYKKEGGLKSYYDAK